MFGLFAALSLLTKPNEGRETLDYENYVRTGQGLPKNRIYRETTLEKRHREELASIRSYQRIEQQIKLIRLMKKLIRAIDQEISNEQIDEDFERMKNQVAKLQSKVERAAIRKGFDLNGIFNLDIPSRFDDAQLEESIRQSSIRIAKEKSNINHPETSKKIISETEKLQMPKDSGDYGSMECVIRNKMKGLLSSNILEADEKFIQ